MLTVATSIGRKRVPTTPARAAIFRAGIDVPTGQMASDRADIEVLYDGLPERSIWTSI
jgi:hypothetical protein